MFFFPLFDDNPTTKFPLITWIIIFLCIVVFIFQLSLNISQNNNFIYSYGLTPILLKNYLSSNFVNPINPLITLITSAFIHGGWFHIAGNMLYLWIFGDNVETSFGRVRFLCFYFLCAVFACLCQFAVNPNSTIPMVGASGAIAGVLASYLLLHPKANVKVFLWIFIFIRLVNIPAWIVLGFWIFSQFLSIYGNFYDSGGGVAYFAHIGGFFAGLILTPIFKRRDIKFFAPANTSSWENVKISEKEIKLVIKSSKNVSVPSFKRFNKTSVPKFFKRK